MSDAPYVSILMLTHNAPRYVDIAVRSLRKHTAGVGYELVVVDNASDEPTRNLVQQLHDEGLIDTLHLSPVNTLFAEGNNIAAQYASDAATHYLLLNSDVRILHRDWLSHLLGVHRRGITSYGIVRGPLSVADGYCLLIDADLYGSHPLDSDAHQWAWAVTKQQATLMHEGHHVQGYAHHTRWLHHFGGKSGVAFLGARGMDVTFDDAARWFGSHSVHVIDGPVRRDRNSVVRRQAQRMANLALSRLPT